MASIENNLQQIRQAIYGRDVRSSIANSIELINKEEENTAYRQACLESVFNKLVISAGNDNSEIVVARGTFPQLRDRLNNSDTKLNEATDKVSLFEKIITTVKDYPVKDFEIESQVKDKSKPYFHIERYGATPDGSTCSSDAIQACVDMCERYALLKYGNHPIIIGDGRYVITKTIQIKCKSTDSKTTPITFIGNDRKTNFFYANEGSYIVPRIPNHFGKDYANAFAINVKYNSENDEDDIAALTDMGVGGSMIFNIMFKNIIIALPDSDMDKYNINGIKMYRTRIHVENVACQHLNRLIWQPWTDRRGGSYSSYNDFGRFIDLTIRDIRYIGLDLAMADNADIRSICSVRPRETAEALISINRGGAIRIDGVLASYHFKTGTTIPRNDVSRTSTSYIKLYLVESASITNTYTERPLFNSFISLEGCHNIKVDGYYERFFGNNFMRFIGQNKNVDIRNVLRDSNLVDTCKDLRFETDSVINGLHLANIKSNDFYNQTITKYFTDSDYAALTQKSNPVNKKVVCNLSSDFANEITAEKIHCQISWNGSKWVVLDRNRNDITDKYFNCTFVDNYLKLDSGSDFFCILRNVAGSYISGSVPFIAVQRNYNNNGIHFYDLSGALQTATNTKMCCNVELELIRL